MFKKILFLILLYILLVSCSHKEIKEKIIIENKIETEDTTDDIENVYNRLVESIIKKDLNGIASCYTEDATFRYSEKTEEFIVCFDNTKSVSGRENIRKNYDFQFKNKYLNRIEYDTVKVERNIKPPRIIFINAWVNSDYDFYEIIEFVIVNKKYYIKTHNIYKGIEIRDLLKKE